MTVVSTTATVSTPAIAPERWLRTLLPAPDCTLRLFCLPHAGGTASFYAPLAAALGRLPSSGAVELVAIQYPGRHERFGEPCFEDLRELAAAVAEVLAPHASAAPFALFGHSMGATVAFEAALLLEAQGSVAATLYASGRTAPGTPPKQPEPTDDLSLVKNLRRMGVTDSRVLTDPDLLELVLPAIRADYAAVRDYRFQGGPNLACPITALVGDEDEFVSVEDAQAWQLHTEGEFELRVFPGGHFFIAEHSAALAGLITGS
jgi:surfactin synthase thioesterase subunit